MTQLSELVAHRGDMTRYPENTLPAFNAVIEAGARFVEFDVQMSGDGVPIVIHDEDLKRVAGLDAHVKDMDAGDLQQIEASLSAPPFSSTREAFIPTLKTLISFMNEHVHVMAFVEIKHEGTGHIGMERSVDSVLVELESAKFPFSVISYSKDIVQFVHKSIPCPIGLVLNAYDARSKAVCASLAPDYVFCDVNHLPLDDGPFWSIGGKWVIYEIKDPRKAMAMFERGAAMIETGDIITLMRELPFNSEAHD